MTGLLGDLRGLKEGFMVVFVASERQKMENNFEDKLPVLPPAEEARWGEERRESLSSSLLGREIGRGMRDLLDLGIWYFVKTI